MAPQPAEFTQLLLNWSNGDRAALDALVPLVYDELRRIASRSLQRESAGHTLQTTAVVHEAYLRLVEQDRVRWQNRAQFFAIAANLVRRILVDHARSNNASERGGVAAMDERKCRIVELKFFGGLTAEEIASVLDLSEATVRRDWGMARAWLFRELNRKDAECNLP
jgi:DNA-directed RNA polymerase specialized sigma24 family protein